MDDLISRQDAINAMATWEWQELYLPIHFKQLLDDLPTAQPDIEKICARIKAEAIKRNVEYMKHGDRYMLGFVDGMRLARRIVDGTIDDPVYFTTSGEKQNENTSRQHQKSDPTQRYDAEGSR